MLPAEYRGLPRLGGAESRYGPYYDDVVGDAYNKYESPFQPPPTSAYLSATNGNGQLGRYEDPRLRPFPEDYRRAENGRTATGEPSPYARYDSYDDVRSPQPGEVRYPWKAPTKQAVDNYYRFNSSYEPYPYEGDNMSKTSVHRGHELPESVR